FTLQGTRVGPDGSVLDPNEGKTLRHDTVNSYPTDTDLAFAGDEYLLVWHETQGATHLGRAQRLTPSLDRLGPLATVFTLHNFSASPHIATDGDGFFLTWEERRGQSPSRLWGTRINHAGQVLDPGGILITDNANSPAPVTWDGTNWFSAYLRPSGSFADDVFATRISPQGQVLDPQGLAVKISDHMKLSP